MSWAATAVTVGVGAYNSSQSSKAANKAARATGAAADQSEALNRERFEEARGLMSPYIGRSEIASRQLMAELGLEQYDPALHDPARPEQMEPQQPGSVKGFLANAIRRVKEEQGAKGQGYMAPSREYIPASAGQYEARDLTNLPGYQAAIDESLRSAEQSAASSGSTSYGGRRLKEAGKVGSGVQQSYYTNYMNMLQNMSDPSTATNLAGMGVGQGQSIGKQNIAATGMAQDYRLQGVAAQNKAVADIAGGITEGFI